MDLNTVDQCFQGESIELGPPNSVDFVLLGDLQEFGPQYDDATRTDITARFGRGESQDLPANSLPDGLEGAIRDFVGQFGKPDFWIEASLDDLEQTHSGFLSYQPERQLLLILRIESEALSSSSGRFHDGVARLGKVCAGFLRQERRMLNGRYTLPRPPAFLFLLTLTRGFPNLSFVWRRAQVV